MPGATHPINVADIRDRVWDVTADKKDDGDEPTLIKWIKDYVATADMAKNTRLHYLTVTRRLMEYGKILRWEHLTVDNIYAWDVWLRHQEVPLTKNQKAAGWSHKLCSDSVYNYHKYLKSGDKQGDEVPHPGGESLRPAEGCVQTFAARRGGLLDRGSDEER